jgi:hypothetical protein
MKMRTAIAETQLKGKTEDDDSKRKRGGCAGDVATSFGCEIIP